MCSIAESPYVKKSNFYRPSSSSSQAARMPNAFRVVSTFRGSTRSASKVLETSIRMSPHYIRPRSQRYKFASRHSDGFDTFSSCSTSSPGSIRFHNRTIFTDRARAIYGIQIKATRRTKPLDHPGSARARRRKNFLCTTLFNQLPAPMSPSLPVRSAAPATVYGSFRSFSRFLRLQFLSSFTDNSDQYPHHGQDANTFLFCTLSLFFFCFSSTCRAYFFVEFILFCAAATPVFLFTFIVFIVTSARRL